MVEGFCASALETIIVLATSQLITYCPKWSVMC